MARFTLKDAERLLLEPKMIRRACDVARNPAFSKADARTRDAHGKRVIDCVRSSQERECWAGRIAEVLALPSAEFAVAMGREPVKLSPMAKPDGRTRIVGVPTFMRRCVSNVFQDVLTRTGDHLLPMSVRAYRPGSDEAVRHAVLDVAAAVRSGRIVYFAKLDFSSYFSVMPWSAIEGALRHYGYGAGFVEKLITLVRCPLVRRERGRFVEVPNDRGAQMGLPESSTLANMLPWALDQHFEKLAPRVFYVRYSDDILIGSALECEVVGAAKTIQAWCRQHGIKLKGVSPDQGAQTLVQDVRRARIDFLGAEIDRNGRVHLPVAKLKAKLREIEHRTENLVAEGIVEAVSRYGNGGGSEKFDSDDVAEKSEGFLDYWRQLDPEGTRRAEALIYRTFPFARSPRSGGQGVVWVAQLWGAQADSGAEVVDPAVHDACSPIGISIDTSPWGTDRSGVALHSSAETEDEELADTECVRLEPSDDSNVCAQADGSRQEQYTEEDTEAVVLEESSLSPETEEAPMASLDELDDDPARVADGHRTYRFLVTSVEELEDQCLDLDDLDLVIQSIDGAVADPAPDEPPVPPVFANIPIFYIAAARRRAPGPPVTIVATGVAVNGRMVGAPTARTVVGRRDAVVVRAVLEHVARANGDIVVAVEDANIVKRLLQPHRRFRGPLMYGLVADLHAEARDRGDGVRLVGGLAMPSDLTRHLRDAARRELRVRQSPRSSTTRPGVAQPNLE